MALDLKQNLRLSQQLLMTPQLQQAIKLLQMSRMELEEYVSKELSENPVLEEVPAAPEVFERTSDEAFSDHLHEAASIVDSIGTKQSKEVDWEVLSRLSDNQNWNLRKHRDGESPNYENIVTRSKTLFEHLAGQIGEIQLDEEEHALAYKLIGNISSRGYLDIDFEAFCAEERIDLDKAEDILSLIHRLDPPGIGARNLGECLLIQLREKRLKNGVVEKMVEHHLSDLAAKNYNGIARALRISIEDVLKNAALLLHLNPTPGNDFSDEEPVYVTPDVYVFKTADRWHVSMNEDGLPMLRVNDYYKDLAGVFHKGEEKTYVLDKIKSANWLIKSVQQRQRTIYRVAECIVAKQMDFFERGDQFLKPMILRDVANELGVHESTISRVTNNKFAHTPRGIFELKYFFSSSVAKNDGGETSSESVKSMIKEIVAAENRKKPLSDQQILAMLGDKGVHLARRTVAKYREHLGILPSSKRKKYF